jgi:DNA-3-methyladenine glycosylase
MEEPNDFSVLNNSPEIVAKRVLGSQFVREINGHQVIVKIVETEAYHQLDPASHTYGGRTPRNHIMFGPSGYLYVYFTYGMHYCANIVCDSEGRGSAVLIRAVEPLHGVEIMHTLRPPSISGFNVSNGPAKLCQALDIDLRLYGHDLHDAPLRLNLKPELSDDVIVTTTRIGLSKSKNELLRFYIRDNPYVSGKH